MENILSGLFDLLKYWAFEGGITGIIIGAILLFGMYLISKVPNVSDSTLRLFMILLFLSGVLFIILGFYGTYNWKSLKASRLLDKPWVVQLETDDTLKAAQEHKKRFQPDFSDLVILQKREDSGTETKFYIFNLYKDDMDANVGKNLAHTEYKKFGYPEGFKDSASTKNLTDLCKEFEFVAESNFYKCKNE